MTERMKKNFRHYCVAVLAITMMFGTSVTTFAANNSIQVINNLSDAGGVVITFTKEILTLIIG